VKGVSEGGQSGARMESRRKENIKGKKKEDRKITSKRLGR